MRVLLIDIWTLFASGAPDYETDTVIQASLRTELKKDVTVITVAHRLQTIMDYDKIVSGLLSGAP